ncbi:MAG: SNF2-related protein [Bellilinea sp.]
MLVHKESKSLLLDLPDPLFVQNLIPKCRQVNIEGHNLAVYHGIEEVKVLRNIGIEAPSPILHHYGWPGRYTPYDHQRDTASMLTLHKRAFVLNETGTGKSKSALWAADYLISLGLVRKVIIMSKLSTLERVWLEEVFSTLMHRNAVVLHGDKARRLQRFNSEADFYIINHEGLAVMHKEIAARKDIDLIICDEYSEYRNHTTSKFEVLNDLLTKDMRFWGMTATPCPNAPTDAYGLTKLISPERIPQHFGQFKRATMVQVTTYKWRPKPEAYDIAFQAMQPAVRYRKADCLDLPPVVTEERTCELSPEQKQAYDRMRIDLVAEARAGVQITAVNAADKINKLRQILCGAVKGGATGGTLHKRISNSSMTPEQLAANFALQESDAAYIEIAHGPRLQVLLDCIQEAAAKVIVVVPFKGILRILESEVSKHYSCAVLNGDVTPNNRNKIITAFKTEPDPHVLLCHPQVMAHGLNLTEADMCIFYAPIYSNDQFQQVVERFNRPGQTRKMTVIRIGAAGIGLEWEIYKALDGKQDNQATILDMYKRIVA